MALPAKILERLPPELLRQGHGVQVGQRPEPKFPALSLGVAALDEALPDGGLARGAVIEFGIHGAALGTTLSLGACRSLQQAARALGARVPWCAFIDPSGTLYGPGVAAAGIELERLLVVRPPLEALSRVALRIVESGACALTIIDTLGVPGHSLGIDIGAWSRVVRRLSLAVDGTSHSVLLLTDAACPRPLPLPVAQRIELSRPNADKLSLRVAKDKFGRVSSPRPIAWVRKEQSFEGSLESLGVLRRA
jgi:recombination protein RecA